MRINPIDELQYKEWEIEFSKDPNYIPTELEDAEDKSIFTHSN